MVDIDTHRIVDMINSRECDDVVKWLKEYPNLQVVSRDGSITYKKAISEAHSNAIQVTDRFHLLKNLTTYSHNFLRKYLKPRIPIELPVEAQKESISSEVNNKNITMRDSLKDRVNYAFELYSTGTNKSNSCKQANIDIRIFNKLLDLSEDERNTYFKSKSEINHDERVIAKENLIEEVRQMHKQGFSMRSIAKELKISRQTVTKYLKSDATAIHGSYGIKRSSGLLDPYLEIIQESVLNKMKYKEIEYLLREKGYSGSPSLLRTYLSALKKENNKNLKTEKLENKNLSFVERKDITSLLYKPQNSNNNLTETMFNLVCDQYPMVKNIINSVNSFRSILRKKDSNILAKWMEDTMKLDISELKSFVNGLKKDIDSVNNAINLEYNNGLAEGTVNKIKVIKRIMYGRCDFNTLRTKVLRLESLKI